MLIDPPASVNPVNVTFSDETAICNAVTQLPATIRIVYVGGLSSGNGGETWDDATVGSSDVRQGASFVIFGTGPLAAAHEAGHSLTSKPGGHFKQPTTAGTRLMNTQNHMKQQFLGPEGMTAPKRLWDQNDGDGFNQFTAIRGSRYTRS